MAQDQDPQWILYIDIQNLSRSQTAPYNAGSTACMRMIEELDLEGSVAVQDCHLMRRQGFVIPPIVRGTPTLVHRVDRRIFTGTDALLQLTRMVPVPTERMVDIASTTSALGQTIASKERGRIPPNTPTVASQLHTTEQRSTRASQLRPEQPSMPAPGDEPSSEKDMLHIGMLVDNPPEDDEPSGGRVTEADVQRALSLRKGGTI